MPRLVAPYLIPHLLRWGERRVRDMRWSHPDGSTVVLSFDDGPGRHTPGLLDALRAVGVTATFFVLGNRCRIYPATVDRIYREGHTLALHGMEHRAFDRMSENELRANWTEQRRLLRELVPALPSPVFCRPPFGHAGKREARLARSEGLELVQMTCLPGRHILWPPGWEEPPDLMAQRVAQEIRPGGIVTLHDGEDLGWNDSVHTQKQVAQTALQVVKAIRQRGLTLGNIRA